MIRKNVLGSMLLGAALTLAPPAMAKDQDAGIKVTVRVLDAETGLPIPTAVVRHPREQERHRVNTDTGSWGDSVLYLPDGSELRFTKGMVLDFEITAPGYNYVHYSYTVRKRRNEFDVHLQKMDVDMSDEDPEDVMIQFGRDKPID